MNRALRQSIKEYLQAQGRLEFEKLGPEETPSRRTDDMAAAMLMVSLHQTRKFQARVQWVCVALLCSVFALQATLMAYGFFANSTRTILAGGMILALIPVVWMLRQIWIDSVITELVRDIVRDRPPGEAVTLIEMIYWDFLARHRRARLQEAGSKEKGTPILFVTSDPTDATRLRLGKEAREIEERLQIAELRHLFKLHLKFAARTVDLVQGLLNTQPDIVHFSGHGASDGALCFENESGQAQRVPPAALSALFQKFPKIKCVLLNACYSELQATAIAEHIEYVIGMQGKIADHLAISFAVGFYQALGSGRSLEEAHGIGCAKAIMDGLSQELAPLLIHKS